MSEIFNFIDKKLISIKPPKKGQVMYRDKKEQGLILRVSYAGSKTFSLYKRINDKPRMIKIGKFPKTSIAEARIVVRDLKSKIEKGEFQEEDKIATSNELTFKELVDEYINRHIETNSKNPTDAIEDFMWSIKNANHLYSTKLSIVSKNDILNIFNTVSSRAPTQANRVIAYIKAVFNKGIKWEYTNHNPALNIEKNRETARDRYITTHEKDKFFKALYELKNESMRDIFLLSLFTGARSGNIVSMRWDKICFENNTWSIPSASKIKKQGSKNGNSITVHFNEHSREILANRKEKSTSEWVFPSDHDSKSGHIEEPRKAWVELCKNAGLEDLRIHDLRHTHASWLVINGASLPVVSKALGHQSLQSTARYAHLNDSTVKEAVNDTFNKITIKPKDNDKDE